MAKFTDRRSEEFIIRQFGATSSPAIVRREFIRTYKIVGRAKNQLRLTDFTRVNKDFDQNGSIFRKKKLENPTRKTPQKVEEVRSFLGEKSSSSVRKSAPQFDISPSTYWRIVKKHLNMRFYLHKAV